MEGSSVPISTSILDPPFAAFMCINERSVDRTASVYIQIYKYSLIPETRLSRPLCFLTGYLEHLLYIQNQLIIALYLQWSELPRLDGATGCYRLPTKMSLHPGIRMCWWNRTSWRRRRRIQGQYSLHDFPVSPAPFQTVRLHVICGLPFARLRSG